jgi:branched-chain amino acid transport system substrate-binding protein
MFRLCGRDDDQAPAAAKFLKEHLKAKTVFIVDDKTTYSQGLADGVSKACQGTGHGGGRARSRQPGRQGLRRRADQGQKANADVFYMSLQGYSPGA